MFFLKRQERTNKKRWPEARASKALKTKPDLTKLGGGFHKEVGGLREKSERNRRPRRS